jgi:cytochrome c biogenesis protein CcdA
MKRLALLALTLSVALVRPAVAQEFSFQAAVQSIEARVEPAEARPGQTVTVKVEVKLTEGWYTYPVKQPDQREAASQTKIELPPPGILIFVEPVTDPDHMKSKPGFEGSLGYYPGGLTWEFKAVVSPSATPSDKDKEVPVKLKIVVCYADETGTGKCLPPKPVTVPAKFRVAGSPVEVEPKYLAKVTAATNPAPAPRIGTDVPAPSPKSKPPSTSVGPKEGPTPAPPPGVKPPPAEGPTPVEGPGPAPVAEGRKAVAHRMSANQDHAADLKAVLDQLPPPDGQGSAGKRIGFGGFVATAAFWGLITLLTPCVFPMIPITVTIFLKQSEKQGTNVLALALVYALTIVVLLSVAAMTLLTTFSRLAVNPITNVLLGALFVVLALSLFGLFEITLPSSVATALDNRAAKGGYLGTVFMAASFTVVSFTCVAPFLGGFTGLSSAGNFSTLELAGGALAFAVAFASPFFLLAMFPSLIKKLPKSGDWMNMVKVAMGFLELAAALKFFRTAELRWLSPSQYFTYDMVLAMWVGILLAMALYLFGVFRTKHDHEMHDHVGPWRIIFALGSLGLAVYLTPALFGVGPKERNRPAGVVFAWVDSFLLPEPAEDLPWTADLRHAVETARARNGRVFVDFTGVTCTNCRLNENNVFTKPEVRELFKQYQLVQMYTDTIPPEFYETDPDLDRREADAAADLDFQTKGFGTEQLPLYVILKPEANGKITVVGVYDEGKINNEGAFVEFLKSGLR